MVCVTWILNRICGGVPPPPPYLHSDIYRGRRISAMMQQKVDACHFIHIMKIYLFLPYLYVRCLKAILTNSSQIIIDTVLLYRHVYCRKTLDNY